MKRKYHMFFFSYTPVIAFSSCPISFASLHYLPYFPRLFCAGICVSRLSCLVLSCPTVSLTPIAITYS
ncbi:hypothetical protein BDW72DRAFT_107094 [Aspergillus terricola var. indicus]